MPVTNFIWDELSDNVLLETDENNVVTAAYHHRAEPFGELLSQQRSGVDRFFHFDGQHSTSDLTASNQKVTDTFSFTAFGEEVSRTGTTNTPFGFKGAVGYYTNEATNDIYVRNRTYEPVMGRWLSADPLGFVDGSNLYRPYFVPGRIDPSGKITVIPLGDNFDNLECGDVAQIQWDFKLDKAAPCDGYIVQKVSYDCGVSDCEDCEIPPKNLKQIEFWEAWPVSKDRFYPTDRYYDGKPLLIPPLLPPGFLPPGKISKTDTSSAIVNNGKCGYKSSFGEIRFYCKDGASGTGVLEKDWTLPLIMIPGCNKVFNLPATTNPPKFWTLAPVEGTAYRHALTVFNCCFDCDDPFVAANGSPRK